MSDTQANETVSAPSVAQKWEMQSLRRNLNQIMAVLTDAVEDVQRVIDFTEHDDAFSPDAHWADIVSRLQKDIIALPSHSQTHYLTQIAHKLEELNKGN